MVAAQLTTILGTLQELVSATLGTLMRTHSPDGVLPRQVCHVEMVPQHESLQADAVLQGSVVTYDQYLAAIV